MARIKPKQLLIQSKTKKSPSRISYSSIITWNLIVVLVVLSLYATYRHWHHRPSFEAEMDLPLDENVERSEDSMKISTPNYADDTEKTHGMESHFVLSIRAARLYVNHELDKKTGHSLGDVLVMDTAKGSITIEIYKDASAGVVDRFVKLCKTDYFKGMPFRHVIKNFVIQGGDFDFNGAAQEWILKAKASGENTLSPKHEAFMIGTTKSPNSKGFDIFITTAPIPDLNDKIVVFGRVIKGEDIVQEIEEIDTDDHYQPKTPIGIINMTLRQEL